jgi:hypothetical protein
MQYVGSMESRTILWNCADVLEIVLREWKYVYVVCFRCSWGLGCFTQYTAAVGVFGACAWYMTYCVVERGVLAAAKC